MIWSFNRLLWLDYSHQPTYTFSLTQILPKELTQDTKSIEANDYFKSGSKWKANARCYCFKMCPLGSTTYINKATLCVLLSIDPSHCVPGLFWIAAKKTYNKTESVSLSDLKTWEKKSKCQIVYHILLISMSHDNVYRCVLHVRTNIRPHDMEQMERRMN